MSKLLEVVFHICFHARNLGISLPKARLVKLVYLADWKSAIETGHQITEIKWFYNHYGPYVKEVIDLIDNNPNFVSRNYINNFGKRAEKIDLRDQISYDFSSSILSEQDRQIIDYISDITKNMGYSEFLRLVYSTYPIIKSEKYNFLDLVKLANEYSNYKSDLKL